ncbi:hypothetical protein WT77_22865 [Burkholderia stagnalis]|nr:hypothetical protein WT18_10675 [Burkholderia stagnalis]KVP08823.1 hypothetical protein WT20_00385 [Burkholderia stagnalis]KVW90359.1 hypothetical protein WT30_26685 [Burkholderia stagnalis]KWH72331.1 hypothetical protein WT66_25450 [Burkholderia stagnalis]KWK20645.1 hypothetical protein WT77_22865 [Burkholderia stagnalis]
MLGVRGFHPDSTMFVGANLWEMDGFVERLETTADPNAEKFREALNEMRKHFKHEDMTGTVQKGKAWGYLRAHVAFINEGMMAREKVGDHMRETPARISSVSESASVSGAPDASNQSGFLRIGHNDKGAVLAYIERRSREILSEGATTKAYTKMDIAEVIAGEMKAKGYRGDRNAFLSASTIVRNVPTGLTGGRVRNGRKA